MRRDPATRIVALVLAMFIPAAVLAQDINGDSIFLTEATPAIFFDDTTTVGDGNEWAINGLDQYFRVYSYVAADHVLRVDANSFTASFGFNAQASGNDSIALGFDAVSVGDSSAALGRSASATGNNSTAVGNSASSVGFGSAALGRFASSGGQFSAALGYQAATVGDYSTALGYSASATGEYSIALGVDAYSAPNSTALGRSASAAGAASIALGFGASSAGSSSAAMGLSASSVGNNSIALGRSASSVGSFSTAQGYDASSSGEASISLGSSSNSAGDYSAALGYVASSAGLRSTALGYRAFADQPDTIILGSIAGVNGATAYANVGMGTSAPTQAVDVERSGAAARFQLTSFTAVAEEAPQYIQRRARGTRLAPTAVQNQDNLGLFSFRGYNGINMGGSRATITAQAAGDFTSVSTPTRLIFATTPVGQTGPVQVMVITPDGKVQVNGQNLTVPDYVFEEDYELMPLEELRSFIDSHGHLPGIPSADEVNSEGLDLAGSQMGLLQKVEELTLYTLQQEGRLADQESLLETQQEQLLAQQERIDRLEALLERIPAYSD